MEQIVDFFGGLFDSTIFPPRWICGKWTDFHGWVYIISNLMIWSAYFAIPIILVNLVVKRTDLPFKRIFWWFVTFILLCGATHAIDAYIFWNPIYRFNALLLFTTGVVSWITVYSLVKFMPEAMKLKTNSQLERILAEKTEALQRANLALASSERQFRALVNNNPDVIARVDSSGCYSFVNQSARTILGTEPSSMVGGKVGLVEQGNKSLQAMQQLVQKATETGNIAFGEVELDASSVNGRYLRVTAVPLKGEDQTIGEVLTVSRDISLEKHAQEEANKNVAELRDLSRHLAEKNRQFEDLAHIVSHNLRSPIGNYRTLLELFEKEETEEGKALMVSKLREVTDDLAQTVTELSQVMKARQDLWIAKEHIDLKAKVDRVLTGLSEMIRDKQAQITTDLEGAPSVHYPRVYIRSILLNLLTNALKYADPERAPQIHIKSWKEGGTTFISVSDNGLGIDLKKYGSKLFGMKQTFHKHPDSRGVGLFITRNQVEAMGGTISAVSEPGTGTTFTVALNKTEEPKSKLGLVLIAEDNDITRFALQRDISRLGMVQELESCSNGHEAMEYLLTIRKSGGPMPELIILDLDMPLMDGWEFLEAFRALPLDATNKPCIVVSSAAASDSDIEKLQNDALVLQFVPKPFSEEKLVEVLNRVESRSTKR